MESDKNVSQIESTKGTSKRVKGGGKGVKEMPS